MFGRLNIQDLGVNSFMYCDALAMTTLLVVLHVPGYSVITSQFLAVTEEIHGWDREKILPKH
jgi:hypothetical protein